ncbi:hypothetical protein EMIHUDRAFT_228921 [Emiliania huxleyi CCMP1516]|uniref:Uncharacterized protein n=2 Tax=Emiliania huxleyi TaxID=2903 RepID=A0A0D3KE79_EMIH1|nr:hypothetical protein EMIHUDRAFT_228921 [Emiliania huxleyi CCMP1516]EOD34064.1 hypothetical protein EMIHUDRAFT_228921 [Emiliania huxleyi CCMP1516]|eukprot:XP_005786493.1 hypothetical protein EMIHUDRAFT_228921 [Emiliania huxleyi CCMP1516]
MRRVALAGAALAFCLPAQWVADASAAVACLTAATGRRLGASARLGVAIVASATRLDSTLSQGLPHALARVMAHATLNNDRLASRKCDRIHSQGRVHQSSSKLGDTPLARLDLFESFLTEPINKHFLTAQDIKGG